MDTRYWSREFMCEFIELYRCHPSLWKVGSKDYTNKNLKRKAYNELIELCKNVDHKADKNFVTKKIQAVRGCFRKEFRKVEHSKSSGATADEVYTPTLWYYDLLLFTKDEEPVSDLSMKTGETELTEDNTTEILQSLSADKEEEIKEISKNMEITPKRQHTSTILSTKRPRKADEEKSNFLKSSTTRISTIEEDEHTIFASNVSAKLRRMDDLQRIYAENLINQVIFKGQLKKLTETSLIIESPPSKCINMNSSYA